MILLLAIVLAQSNVVIQNPTNPTKRTTTTTSGGKEGLDVNCIGGCSGSSGGGGGDGGYTIVIQGTAADGGFPWDTYSRIWDGADKADVTVAGRLQVDGSGVTQPISGSVTANAGSNLNTSALALDATLTGGTEKAIARGGAKGATVAADVTSTANGVDHQGLDVTVQNTVTVGGTVTANAGSNLNTSALALDATLTGRTQKAQVTDGTRDGTVKAASTAALATDTSLVIALSPNSPLPAGTAVIGHVVADTGSTTAVTGNVTVVQGTGTNLHAVLDTTSTTAVTQATGTNLHAVLDTTSTTACTQATGTNLHVVTDATSVLAANQSVNTAQIAGNTTSTGVGASGTGTQRTASLIHDGTTTVGVIVGTTALKVDTASVAGTATVTAAAGVQKVGIVGNANAAIDAANNAAAPANVVAVGYEAQSSALGTSATASNVRRGVVGLDGVQYVREGGPLLFTGGVTAIAASLTQVVAAPAAGTSLYLTDIMVMSDTATAGTFLIRYGTVSNCGTGTASIYPSAVTAVKSMYPGNASAPLMLNFHTPLKIPAANALCILCVATNTCTAQFWGYTAP